MDKKKVKKMQTFQETSNCKGITLVALVITIIIIIILAVVAISFTFGDNGLIKRAENAGDYYANDTAYTEGSITNVESYINDILVGTGGNNSEETFEPIETPEPPTGGIEMDNMTNGIIEIKWLKENTYNVSAKPNAPKIKTDLPAGTTMEQVVFDEKSKTWISGTEYSYVVGTGSQDNNASHWANAKVTINNVDSYFVWIPRYAYRIIYFDSVASKKAYLEGILTEEDGVVQGKIIGYSDSRGIVDAHGKKIASIASTTKTMVSEDYFMVHPAFIKDVNNGGWTEELEGIWIGKYEASSVEGNSDSEADNTTSKTVKIQSGASSWRYINVGNCYTVSQKYAPRLESHMLKNSEWGAVAYLTESTYGRNGTQITQNKDLDYTTGGGTAYVGTYRLQSSTGNEYGIFDLSGGAAEYVAGYYKNGNVSYGSSFADGTSDGYSTTYGGTDEKIAYKYGDATLETKGWHLDRSYFVKTSNPFFSRGGTNKNNYDYAGVFDYNSGAYQR